MLVAQSCLTLCDPMDCSQTGSSVHEIFPGKVTGVGYHFLLQGIFPTRGSNPIPLHCRQILYRLSYKGSPSEKSPNKHCLSIYYKYLDQMWVFWQFSLYPIFFWFPLPQEKMQNTHMVAWMICFFPWWELSFKSCSLSCFKFFTARLHWL